VGAGAWSVATHLRTEIPGGGAVFPGRD
jgi:hypothetical protein